MTPTAVFVLWASKNRYRPSTTGRGLLERVDDRAVVVALVQTILKTPAASCDGCAETGGRGAAVHQVGFISPRSLTRAFTMRREP